MSHQANDRLERLKAFASQRKLDADTAANTPNGDANGNSDATNAAVAVDVADRPEATSSTAAAAEGPQGQSAAAAADTEPVVLPKSQAVAAAKPAAEAHRDGEVGVAARPKAADAARVDADAKDEDALSEKLRQLALPASPNHIGISVRALVEHLGEVDASCNSHDLRALVEVLSSNEVGPAEVLVVHDATAPFTATLASLVKFVATAPNAMNTFVWIDVACVPRPVRNTRSLLHDLRNTMADIGKVLICTESLGQFTVVKQSWCLCQIDVASSVGCQLQVCTNDLLDLQASLYDDTSWDKMLTTVDFASSEFSGAESEKMELLRECGVSVVSVFNKRVRLALDRWYVDKLSTVCSLEADEKITEELNSKISRMTTLSRVYINRKQFSKARPLCVECYRCAKRSLSAAATQHGSDSGTLPHSLVCDAASQLARVHDELDEHDLARTLHNEILEISVKVFGQDHNNTVNARHSFASHLRKAGSLQSAKEVEESVLKIRKMSAETSLEVAASAELLGLIHEDLHELDSAASCHQSALDIRQQHLTPDHECTWSSMNAVAGIRLQQGAAAQAEVLLRQVYESTTRVLGEHDSVTLSAAAKLASCLKIQGSHAAALTLQLKILHGHRSIVSVDNAEVVISLGDVAETYCSFGKLREGLDVYERAISASQKVHGSRHCSTLVLQRQAAAACIDMHLHDKALDLLENFFQNAQGIRNFIQIQDILLCVVAQFHLENYDVALELIDVAFIEFAQDETNHEPHALMELHFHRAQVMSKQNRWIEAKLELETCLSFCNWAPTDKPVVWSAAAALATATAKCGDVVAGEKIIREGHAMALTVHGAHGSCTLEAQHFLVRFLFETFGATSAQRKDAEAIIIRTVEAKRLLFGAGHNSTIRSFQLMCEILFQSGRRDLYETALLDLLSSCQSALGWLCIDTIDVLFRLAVLYDCQMLVERAELLYIVGLCLLRCTSSDQAAILLSKTQCALLELYRSTAQIDKMAILRAVILPQAGPLGAQPIPFISRNFSVEILKESMYPQFVTQLFHTRVCDLKRALPTNHPAFSLLRFSEATLARAIGQNDSARALFSSCVGCMGACWWYHPDCSFVVISLASVMIDALDFESASALLKTASSRACERNPHVSIQIMLSAADMFVRAHNTELAIQFLERVVALQSLHLGAVSSSTLSSQHLLADLHVASGAWNKAECVMWDALESCQTSLGHSHELTIEWLQELSKLYVILNDTPKATFMALAALNTSTFVFGEMDVRTLAAMERYATMCRASGQLTLCRELFERCLQLRVHTQGVGAASTNATRAALAEVQVLLLPQTQEQETVTTAQEICEMEIDATRALREDDVRSALQILAARFGIAKDTFGTDSVRAARAAASYGFILLHSKQFQKSQSMLNDAVVVLQRHLGGENKEVVVCKSAWARALVGIGDLKHAEEIIIDCLDACERSLGLNDNFSVKILRQLGQLYSSTDVKLHTARELFQECFSHACAQLQYSMGNASPESTNSEYFEVLDDLVGVFVKLNDLESAQVVLQQANETLLKLYGISHWSTLEAASRWANVLVLMGSPQKALPLFEHVLYVRSMTLGSASHATVCAAEDFAHAYEMLSRFDDAEMLLRLSVIQRRAAGQFSPSEFISSLLRLALILQKGGKFECAVLCFLECLEERSRQPVQPFSRDCVEIIAAENAGFCFMKMGLGQRARIMLSYCVQLLRMPNVLTEAAVKQHMRVCLSNLGVVSASEGNLSEAEINFQACVLLNSSGQTAEDAVHSDFADAAWNLAVVYHKSGKVSQSESFFVKCIQAYEQSQDFAKASDAKYSLALLYRDMGQVKKAEEALLQHKLGDMNPDFITLSTELAVFFQENGNPRAALPLYQQSLNLASAIGQHGRILYIQLALAQVYMALGMMENSLECARNSARGRALLLGAEHPLTLQSIAFFITVGRRDHKE